MHTNTSWKDYIFFSKKERAVVIGLLMFLVASCLLLTFYQPAADVPEVENLDAKLSNLSPQTQDNNDFNIQTELTEGIESPANAQPVELFEFDPNTLDENGFKRLGLRNKTIRTLINYRNKGGQFRKPGDIRKIYGLTTAEADRLIPFIHLPKTSSFASYSESNSHQLDYVKAKPQVIDINTATIEQWKALPAIGEVLSNRIVKYRDKMGGFSSVSQVKNTYGLSESAFNAILPYLTMNTSGSTNEKERAAEQKLNINEATASELKQHPAIPPEIAEAIVIYRKQHGSYHSVEDIRKIVFINEVLYQKVAPFLAVQ